MVVCDVPSTGNWHPAHSTLRSKGELSIAKLFLVYDDRRETDTHYILLGHALTGDLKDTWSDLSLIFLRNRLHLLTIDI